MSSAYFDETIGKDWNQVVHQILSDRLTLLIELLLLFLTNLCKICLGMSFLLLSNLLFDTLFHKNSVSGKFCLVHDLLLNENSSLGFNGLLLVLEVYRCLNSFDVDLEGVEKLFLRHASVLSEELDVLLLKELLNGRLGHL